jgi:hypothetical protein
VRVDGSVGDAIAREEDTLLCRLLHLSMGHCQLPTASDGLCVAGEK